jgi:hypothetical protein
MNRRYRLERAADTVQHRRTPGEMEPGRATLLTDDQMRVETDDHRQGEAEARTREPETAQPS